MIPSSTQHDIHFSDIAPWKTNPRLVSGRSAKQAQPSNILAPAQQGIPKPVKNMTVTTAPKIINGVRHVQVSIAHQIAADDDSFHHANVWMTGYLGNPNPQLISGSTKAPHTILLPPTGDNVSLTVQSVGKDGSFLPLEQSPTRPISLK